MEEEAKSLSTKEFLQALREEHKSIKEEQKELQKIQSKLQRQRDRYDQKKLKSGVSPDDLQQLRERFTSALTRLNSIDTRDVAIKEIRGIIEKNTSKEALRMYLSSLSEHRKGRSHHSREQEVALIGYIAQIYGDKLLETGPNPLKTLIRMAEISQVYFKDLKREVHIAAGNSLCDIYKHAFPKDSKDAVMNFMFEPLNWILASGIDVKAQQAAAYALFKWTEVLVEENNLELLQVVYERTIGLFCRLRAEFPDMISALGWMSEKCGFETILKNLIGILNKLILYIRSVGPLTHVHKIEASKLLIYIGKQINSIKDIDLGNICREVTDALERVKSDKLPAVQKFVRDALNEWNQIGESAKERRDKSAEREVSPGEIIEAKKLVENLPRHKGVPNKISPPRSAPVLNQFKTIRDIVKIQKEKNAHMKEDTSTSWGNNKPKFLEKRTGQYAFALGNGHVDLNNVLSRPSIRELVKNKQDGVKSSIEVYYKEPTQLNRVVVPREQDRAGREEIQQIEPINQKEGEIVDKENVFAEFKAEKSSANFAPPPSVGNVWSKNEDLGSPKGISRDSIVDSLENLAPLNHKNTEMSDKSHSSLEQPQANQMLTISEQKGSSLDTSTPKRVFSFQEDAEKSEPCLGSDSIKNSKSIEDSIPIPKPVEKRTQGIELPVFLPDSSSQSKLESNLEIRPEIKLEPARRLITSSDNPLLTNSGIDKEIIAKELLNKILHPEHISSDDLTQDQARDLLSHLLRPQSESSSSRDPEKYSSTQLTSIKEEPIAKISHPALSDTIDQTPKLSIRSEPTQGFSTDLTPKRMESRNSFSSIPSPRFKTAEALYRPSSLEDSEPQNEELVYTKARITRTRDLESQYNPPKSHIAPPQKHNKEEIPAVFIEKLKYEILTGCQRIDRGLESKFIEMDEKIQGLDERLECAYECVATLYDLQNYKKTMRYAKVGMATQTTDRQKDLAISTQSDLAQISRLNSIEIQTDHHPLSTFNYFTTLTQTETIPNPKYSIQIQTDFNPSNEIGIMTETLSRPSLSLNIPPSKEVHVDSSPSNESKLDSLTQTWINALKELNQGNIDQAYSLVLESGDDIYLLRLMLKTGTCLGYLSKPNALRVMKKLSMILNSFFMENLGMIWFTEHITAFKELGKEEKSNILECLNRLCFMECQEATKAQQILSYLRNI